METQVFNIELPIALIQQMGRIPSLPQGNTTENILYLLKEAIEDRLEDAKLLELVESREATLDMSKLVPFSDAWN